MAFLPFLALQSSVSVWYQPVNEDVTTITTGSLFVASSFAIAAVVALIAPCILKRIDASVTIAICNGKKVLIVLYNHYY